MLPYNDSLTREENRILAAFQTNQTIIRQSDYAGDINFHKRKLESIKEEMLLCPNLEPMCILLSHTEMMTANEMDELLDKRVESRPMPRRRRLQMKG